MSNEKMIPRREAPKYIRDKFGIPTTKSTVDKSRMFGKLKPDLFYGPKELFFPGTLDAFAQTLLSKKPAKLFSE